MGVAVIAKKKTLNKPVYIYVLIDPRDNEVRYVGKTAYPKARIRNHIVESVTLNRNHRHHWINDLLKNGLKPKLDIVCQTTNKEASNKEIRLIKAYKRFYKLTNATLGGDGSLGVGASDKNRARMRSSLNPGKLQNKMVVKMDIDGKELEEYESISDAAKKNNLNRSNISRACRGIYNRCGGMVWKFKTLENEL